MRKTTESREFVLTKTHVNAASARMSDSPPLMEADVTASNGDTPPTHDFGETLGAVAARRRFTAGTELTLDGTLYFPLDAVTSLLIRWGDTQFQVGFGQRGDIIGVQPLFAPEFPAMRAKILKAGTILCVCPRVLERLMRDDRGLRERFASYALRATCRFLDETARMVTMTLERRVARWIVGCHEALARETLPVSHQELATSLGVRRSGVTVALHMLEGEHLIRSRRMRIEVLDLAGLAAYADRTLARAGRAAGHRAQASSAAAQSPQPALT